MKYIKTYESHENNNINDIIEYYSITELKDILDKDILDINGHYNGQTPLCIAAKHGMLDKLILILEHGADVNKKTKNGDTPLHWAVSAGSIECIKTLLEYGADVNSNNKSYLPINVIHDNLDILHILIENGADIFRVSTYSDSAIEEYAAEFTYPDWQRLVLKHQPEVAGKLAEKIVIDPEVKKEFKHLFDSAELGLL